MPLLNFVREYLLHREVEKQITEPEIRAYTTDMKLWKEENERRI